jgi:hypothetical protein
LTGPVVITPSSPVEAEGICPLLMAAKHTTEIRPLSAQTRAHGNLPVMRQVSERARIDNLPPFAA